jgi:PleD family two-component response regulator
MDDTSAQSRKPLVLIAGQHGWFVRSLESIFASSGFSAVTISNDELTVGALPDVKPDLVVLEADPPDVLWRDIIERLRLQAGLSSSTPIIATTAEPLTRQKRLEAMRAGAWDVFGHPLDGEILTLKAWAYARAKMDADDARERGLVDPETDLYNVRGVLRRIYEEASQATRHRRPLACLVAAVAPAAEGATEEEVAEGAREAARTIRSTGRASDVFGRLGPNEFVVIAPGTDATGARRFAQRLTGSNGNGGQGGEVKNRLITGFAAVTDLARAEIEPVDLFVRAIVALRTAQSAGAEDDRIRSFD